MRIITILILCFLAGAMMAHARYQSMANAIYRAEGENEAYKKSAIIGHVEMDNTTKQLYFVSGE